MPSFIGRVIRWVVGFQMSVLGPDQAWGMGSRRLPERQSPAKTGPVYSNWTYTRPAELNPHPMSIGTLNEGPLHQALKSLYLDSRGEEEVPIGTYVADVRAGDDVLYEIQTGGFAPLKRKLAALVEEHRVVLVHPVAAVRYIVKLPVEEDGQASRRRSPKRRTLLNVVEELVSIPHLLAHPNFALEVVLTEEEEYRVYDPVVRRRRGGWRVVRRDLSRVLEQWRIEAPEDLFALIPGPLPENFSTADLARATGQPRWLAQKLAYCLRESGAAEFSGKDGNALLYRRHRRPA